MREIKFRGKNEEGEWLIGSLNRDNPQNCYYITDNETGVGIDVDENTIGQFTGLHDKNGKEIYEEDIVKITQKKEIAKHLVIQMKPIIAEIRWSEEYVSYILITLSIKDVLENLANYLEEYDIEVIGNIYDNPNLLEEEV